MNVIEQLRKAIEDSGESLYAIGNESGVDQSVMSRFMNDERGISLETASKLCSYLGLRLTKRR